MFSVDSMDSPNLTEITDNQDEHIVLGRYAERAYLDYAVSVVKGRALPDLCDGQKPVQRRILYAMQEMGLAVGARPVKSARVVGDVLGKFHPHGDQSAYDALVRLAQDFTVRYPLIDGHGNFGSRDGDKAAAMRYTEARLTPLARLLLDELHQGTVDFIPNYDGSIQEPRILPARLPMVLLNGASGIAVGLATEIPPHNLRELALATIALIRKPTLSVEELQKYLPGPDFPGGGNLISQAAEISAAYSSGRGSLQVRANWIIEELARGQWQLVITELPPHTSTQKVLEEIEELSNPKIRPGKKSLSPEQQNLKNVVLSLLETVRDESGKEASVRLVVEPRNSRISRDELINTLLAHTSLEGSVSLNLVMVGSDGRPCQKSLINVLQEWIVFRFDTVLRRTQFRLKAVQDRLHILSGRLIVYLNLDKVIQIIRTADEPRAELMARFSLSEQQADDILDLRLRQLARLEKIKIEEEQARLQKEEAQLQELIDKPAVLEKQIIREIEADAKMYGDERRTRISPAQKTIASIPIIDEAVTIIVSEQGWVRTRNGHGHDIKTIGFRSGDSLYQYFTCRTVDTLIALDTKGRSYTIPVAQFPGGRGDGTPLNAFIQTESGVRIAHSIAGASHEQILICSSGSYGFISTIESMSSRLKAGKGFIRLGTEEQLLPPLRLPKPIVFGDKADIAIPHSPYWLATLSSKRLLLFPLSELPIMNNGGRGLMLQSLDKGDTLLGVCLIEKQEALILHGMGRGNKPVSQRLSPREWHGYIATRAGRGRALPTTTAFKPIGIETESSLLPPDQMSSADPLPNSASTSGKNRELPL